MSVNISTTKRYGPLQEGFSFELGEGYKVVVGRNNSGKSAILQLVFKVLMRDGNFGAEKICFLSTLRDHVQPTTETGGLSFASFNNSLLSQLDGTPIHHSGWNIAWNDLPRFLLNHTDTYGQLGSLNILLERLGLPEFVLRTAQHIHFENVPVGFQGSGLRNLLSILASLTDSQLSVVLIDEPELSLEPDIQRVLKGILVEASRSKRILVATHSHLFLNRADPSSNLLVQSRGGIVSLNPVASEEQLYDLTFQLLGNSTEDLFFPGNFLMVEGSSDQVIVERIRDLLGVPASRLKVMAAGGVGAVPSGVDAVSRILVPVVMRDSPYARKVVALIDRPPEPNPPAVGELRRVLEDRLFILDQPSVEAYIPDEIYTRIGRNKSDDIQQMEALKTAYTQMTAFKKELSQQIASQLSETDLANLPVIVAAVKKAVA